MAILTSEIQFRLSGGGSNADPNASLGGAISSTAAGTNIFANVTSAQASAGLTSYRCIYVRNGTVGGLTWTTAKVYISNANGPGGAYLGDTITIGVGKAAVNGTEQTIATETDAPADTVTFDLAATAGAALSLGDIPAGHHKAVWIKRVISAGATAVSNAGFTLTAVGDTAA